jgi:hypothetical protein
MWKPLSYKCELKEEIYMNIPEGMNSNSNNYLLLTKTIYGLVLSVRKFYKNLISALKEIKFIYYLLQGIRIEIDLPIIVKTDNVGAMFMSQIALSGVRTFHVDTRYHYVQENMEDGIIKIEFIRSEENHSDIFMKNFSQEIYQKQEHFN